MPSYGKRKKVIPKRSKRVYRKRRNRGNPKVRYVVAPPFKQRVALKYTDIWYFNLTTLAPIGQSMWRPNDLFDPFYSGVGHQSMFRDQLYAMYAFARCCAFSVYVRVMSDSLIPTEVCLFKYDVSTLPFHVDLREYKGTRKGFVTSQKPLNLSMSYLVDNFLENRKYTCFTDDSFKQSGGSALPVNASCWVGLSAYSTGTGNVNITYQFNIKQFTQFTEPGQVGGS